MMKKLLDKVTGLVGEELEEANKNNPPLFHSMHEGYGVIAEEMLEVEDESSWLERNMRSLLMAIQRDDWECVKDIALALKVTAINTACECIQVAAMSDKLIETVDANRE